MTDGSGWASPHMKCLVTGAYGFIGSEVVAALRREGATVIGCGRDLELARRVNPAIEWIACDFNTDVTPAHWTPRLAGIDVVVNCVGILQGNLRDDAERIHADATIALLEAAAASGVRRIVHISAVSAETAIPTAYARSKAKADAALSRLAANWLIVKPSLVIGHGAYGGTSLMRGLAGLPFVLPLPGEERERFQPIALDDLARGIAGLAARAEPVAQRSTPPVRKPSACARFCWLPRAHRAAAAPAAPAPSWRPRRICRPRYFGENHLARAAQLRHAG